MGNATLEINVKNLHGGQFRKYATVYSNAKNSPELRISLGGTLKAVIEVSSQNIRLTSKDQQVWSDSLNLTTEKKDLKVTEVTFKPYSSGTPNQTWQNDLKIHPNYTLTKTDSTKGSFTYKLKLSFAVKDTEPKFGEFFIKTNHSKMPEIKVNGSIEGKAK